MYKVRNFNQLLGIKGLSDKLMQNHFSLYEGYVKNVNILIELLDKKPGSVEYSELQRRFGWEFNGMRLHELYFENLDKKQNLLATKSKIKKEIDRTYRSFKIWQKNYIAVGMMRGIGWVVLYYDPIAKELFNVWINEHDVGHFAGCQPLLVMDVFEHAYMLDYGTKKADYIEMFIKNINWQVVSNRFDKVK